MRALILPALLAALLAACAPQPVPGSAEACSIEQVASVPLLPPDPPRTALWAMEVRLDGKPARMMLDTGASGLAISVEAAARLGLRLRGDMQASATGAGGTIYPRVFEAGTVGIGGQTRTIPTLLIETTREQTAGGGYDGILGMEAFDRHDVEIDFPARTLALYRARFCPKGRPPWQGNLLALPRAGTASQRSGNRPVIQVRLDGRPVPALVDTGASDTVVNRSFAVTAGAPAQPPDGASRGTMVTLSNPALPAWLHRFGVLEIGAARIAEPQLVVADIGMSADMILGLNHIGQMRIWISNGSDMVYLAAPPKPPAPAPPPARPQPRS
jgi:predicted aspartyl protease